jgi:Tol biopolymer transport system component
MKAPLLAAAAAILARTPPLRRAQSPSTSPQGASWMRYPAISPDGKTIAFTYKGDIYKVSSAGGTAAPVTTHTANDFMPVWSHDGKQIAFASDRYGNNDIYVISADGGEAKRLTFHSSNELPFSFTADDKGIIYGAARQDASANRQFPTGALPELYTVPAAGGRPIQILTTPAENVKPSRDGAFLIYEDKKGQENQWRKHHTSAVARDIWIYDVEGRHAQTAHDLRRRRSQSRLRRRRQVVLLPERRERHVQRAQEDHRRRGGREVAAAHVLQGCTRPLPEHVEHRHARVRIRRTDLHDGRIGRVAEESRHRRLRRQQGEQRTHRRREQRREWTRRVAHGKEVAFTYRGDVFVNSVEGGGTKRITTTPETETGIEFGPDGKSLIYASERDGKWAIYEARRTRDAEPYFFASTVVKEAPVISNDHQNTHPSYSPDGKELAYLEDRNTLKVMNLATKATRTLLTDKELFGGDHNFQWSPDSKWIVFDYDVPGIAPGEVGLVQADGKGKVVNLTQERIQRRARQVDLRRQGAVVVLESRRAQVGRADRADAERRLRDVLRSRRVGALPSHEGRVRARERGGREDRQDERRIQQS